MIRYLIESEEEIKKRAYDGNDYYDTYLGLNKVRFCTLAHARKVLRGVFDNRVNHSPYVCVHNKPPEGDPEGHRGGMIYEGLKISSWSGFPEDPMEDNIGFTLDGRPVSIKVKNIVEVLI